MSKKSLCSFRFLGLSDITVPLRKKKTNKLMIPKEYVKSRYFIKKSLLNTSFILGKKDIKMSNFILIWYQFRIWSFIYKYLIKRLSNKTKELLQGTWLCSFTEVESGSSVKNKVGIVMNKLCNTLHYSHFQWSQCALWILG